MPGQSQIRSKMRQGLVLLLMIFGAFSLVFSQPTKTRKPIPAAALQPRLVVQLGHSSAVLAAVLSHDNRFVVTGSSDKTACLWEAETGRMIRCFTGHSKAIDAVAIAPDNTRIATGSIDEMLRVWDTATGRELWRKAGYRPTLTIPAPGRLGTFVKRAPQFAPDGKTVLLIESRDQSETALLLDSATGAEIRRFAGDKSALSFAAFSPTGKFVIVSSVNANTVVYDAHTGEVVQQFPHLIVGATYAKDGRTYLLAQRNDAVLVLDALTGQTSWQHARSSSAWAQFNIYKTAISADGRRLVALAEENESLPLGSPKPKTNLHVWDTETGGAVPLRSSQLASRTHTTFALAADSKTILTGDLDGTSFLSSLETGELFRAFESRAEPTEMVALAPDSRSLWRKSFGVQQWDLSSGETLHQYEGYIWAFLASLDGRYLMTEKLGNAALWDTTTGRMVSFLEGTPDYYRWSGDTTAGDSLFSLSKDGSRAALIYDPHEVRVWDTATARVVQQFRSQRYFDRLALAPDAQTILLVENDSQITLHEVATGNPKWQLHAPAGKAPHVISFSPDQRFVLLKMRSQRLLDASADEVWLLRAADGKLLRRFAEHSLINASTFAPDGNSVLLGCEDNNAYLYDVQTGRLLRKFVGHSAGVTAGSFARDGGLVLTGSSDGTARLWRNMGDGKEICRLAFFKDGTWVVTDGEGRFDTNNIEGLRVNWVMPDEPLRPLPMEIYLRDYYQPQLLDSLLRGESLKPVRDLSRLNRAQPEIKIVKVEPQANQPEFVTVTVEISNSVVSGCVYDLRLFRDGQLVAQRPVPKAWEEAANSRRRITETLEQWRTQTRLAAAERQHIVVPKIRLPRVEAGRLVEFSAYAFNEDRVKSATHRWQYKVKQPLPIVAKRAFLVTIGVNESQSDFGSLLIAGQDAKQMQEKLRTQFSKLGEYEVIAVSLTARQATKSNIQKELQSLAAKAGPEDVVMISISSHGKRDQQGSFYLLPYDIGNSPITSLSETFLRRCISSEELSGWLREIDAGVMTLIIDACHAGAAVKTAGFKPGPMGDPGLGQLAYDKGMQILAASQPEQKALDSHEVALSYLTQALIPEGIVKGQADVFPPDGKITLLEWLRYGVKRVPELHAQEALPKQWQFSGQAPSRNQKPTRNMPPALQRPVLFNFRQPLREVILVQAGRKTETNQRQ